jgi:hypothetical protein
MLLVVSIKSLLTICCQQPVTTTLAVLTHQQPAHTVNTRPWVIPCAHACSDCAGILYHIYATLTSNVHSCCRAKGQSPTPLVEDILTGTHLLSPSSPDCSNGAELVTFQGSHTCSTQYNIPCVFCSSIWHSMSVALTSGSQLCSSVVQCSWLLLWCVQLANGHPPHQQTSVVLLRWSQAILSS